ncbi:MULTISPECIES: hypothetical protein [unclassified Rhodococcus (in: high G+C Gram-positive bacteria)]|uniref:hypothetical protein n=1 Tax=unclassified Rhodococcus (in: high G+C Gram-positive bacteria) TaxID=192944 RepID=UPI00163AAFFD|nr:MULTISPECIES: hypothetical protein [unclassified Rhodococcus (in: high G+C Gram-positive bacteria)]MBC2644478.1 hypothetical protein [Rhodococcus sp. 3A]MBC2897834.1 hypothetical protein [Rhodococcus sp. 4CII]
MARNRWPGIAPPETGGVAVHGHRVLNSRPDLAVQLTGITAYPAGVSLCLVLEATGIPAARARHETRPLTDPRDESAHWSYLRVRIRMDDIAGDADPFEPLSCSPPNGPPERYRTAPRYWIPGYPSTGELTLTTGWHQIGLPASVDVLDLGVSPFSTEAG